MVKTTIILKDEIYKELVKEALEKYGTTRKLSLLINEKLEKTISLSTKKGKKWPTVKIKKKLPPEKIEELIRKGWEEVIKWKV